MPTSPAAGAERRRAPRRTASATLIGCGDTRQRAGLQPAHVEQVLDQPGQPVQRLVGGGEQLVPVGVARSRRPALRRLATAALAEASGVRRSWLTAESSAVRSPVGLGERLGRGGRLGQALLPQRDGGLGGERLDDPPVGGGQRCVRAGRARRRRRPGTSASPSAGVEARLVADAGGDPPGAGSCCSCPGSAAASGAALQQGDAGEAEGLPELVEQRGQRRGCRAARCRPLWTVSPPRRGRAAASRVRRAARSTTALTADGDEQEDDQREHVLPLGDGELVDRWGEVVVEQQEADDGGDQRRLEAADQGDRDDRDAGRAGCRWAGDSSPRSWVSTSVSSGSPTRGQREPGQPPARRSGRGPSAGSAAAAADLLVGDQVDVDRTRTRRSW